MKFRKNSLVRTCIVHFLVYSSVALLLILLLNMAINRALNRIFNQVDLVSEYQTELQQDAFDQIRKHNGLQYVIYDGNGSVLHIEGDKLSTYLKRLNRDLIQEYDQDSFLQSFPYRTPAGEMQYLVAQFRFDEEIGDFAAEAYSRFDADYRQIDGTLLKNGECLSPEDLRFIGGEYTDFNDIYRYEYQNQNGEKRTLISMTLISDMDRYDKAAGLARKMWIGLVPVLLLLILGQSLLFGLTIRKSIKPLDDAIVGYARGDSGQLSLQQIPQEFTHVCEHFKWMRRELDRAKADREHDEQERERYIAGISHDLSTPLTAILGYSKAICDGMVPPEKQRVYLEAIYRKAEICQNLMQTFFEYTRLEHPDHKLHLEHTDLCELMRQYLIEKIPEIELHEFRLEPDIPDGQIWAGVDRGLLLRGLDNLMVNSLKYNKAGTTIFVTLQQKGDRAVLSVGDNGCGIPEGIRRDIFNPFVTGNTARTPGKGTGFGMAVTKKTVELHGGAIELADPPAEGLHTQIRITLPLWQQ